MKLLKSVVMTTLLLSSVAHAINPIQGWYAGLLLGGSKSPDINFNVISPLNLLSGQGVLSYSVLGNVGGQAGYRKNQFRAEGEFLYNNNPYKHMNINGVDIPNAGSPATTVQQLSIQSQTISNPFTFSGCTNTFAWMLNGFYDFYIPNYTEHLVPYVGLGIGYEKVDNFITFFNNNANGQSTGSGQQSYRQISYNFAGQAMVGMSYFLTDHTAFSLDFRYLSATRSDTVESRFNSFQSRPQLYSVNFIFNAAFNVA